MTQWGVPYLRAPNGKKEFHSLVPSFKKKNIDSDFLHRFVFLGVCSLMEDMLIENARLMRLVNEHGIRKMLRNIIALQQGVKAISSSDQPEFTRVMKYFALFFMTPTVSPINLRQLSV
jgi:hypothetical protein